MSSARCVVTVTWDDTSVMDVDRSVAFYTNLLGFHRGAGP
jgi:hypothetical protein